MPFNVQSPNVGTQSGKRTEREILKFGVGLGAIKSVVLSADAVPVRAAGDADGFDGRRVLERGQILAVDPQSGLKYVAYGAGAYRSIAVDATGGTFTITVAGKTTAAIAFNATAAAVKAAVVAAYPGADLVVTGGPGVAGGGTPYKLWFNTPSNPTVTTGAGSLTGGAGTAAVTSPTLTPVGVLDNDVEFLDNTSASDEPANMLFFGVIFKASNLIGYSGNESAVAAALPSCRFE